MAEPLHPVVAELLSRWEQSPHWIHSRAVTAIRQERYRQFTDRTSGDLTRLRLWLSVPTLRLEGGKWVFDSGFSVLLEWVRLADEATVLHDSPWDCNTTILAGAYREALAPDTWPGKLLGLGPAPKAETPWRGVEQTVERSATDLHAIVEIARGTSEQEYYGGGVWTLVTTGPYRESWGFHPPAKKFQPYRQYLGLAQLVKADHPRSDIQIVFTEDAISEPSTTPSLAETTQAHQEIAHE